MEKAGGVSTILATVSFAAAQQDSGDWKYAARTSTRLVLGWINKRYMDRRVPSRGAIVNLCKQILETSFCRRAGGSGKCISVGGTLRIALFKVRRRFKSSEPRQIIWRTLVWMHCYDKKDTTTGGLIISCSVPAWLANRVTKETCVVTIRTGPRLRPSPAGGDP